MKKIMTVLLGAACVWLIILLPPVQNADNSTSITIIPIITLVFDALYFILLCIFGGDDSIFND